MGFLKQPQLPGTFAPFATLRKELGFVPGLFLAQSLKPEFIEAQGALVAVIPRQDKLSRRQKESIAVACSAASLNTYCVSSHCEMLKGLGVDEEQVTQIAVNHHYADLPPADCGLD
jgi:AhpD family alkylhydroperoxidase